MAEPLTAVLLAGGKGSRLEPLTNNLPKPLVLIKEHPIVEILIRQLKRGGVSKIIMAVGHRAEQVIDHLGDGRRFGVSIEYSIETEPLSTVAPLKLIKHLPERFVVANSDILTDLNIADLYACHVNGRAQLTVAAVERSEKIDYGLLTLGENGLVTNFEEKPRQAFTVSTGIYLFERSLLEIVPDNRPFGFDQLMLTLLEQKRPINAFIHKGYWRDIGRPGDYLKAHRDLEKIKHLLA
jgi:NDP-sugar pyrophosphorylase family protein